jgi:hypothetical protein
MKAGRVQPSGRHYELDRRARRDACRTLDRGYSASAIARKLGEVTRNAVMGKIHRLGLTGPTSRAHQSRYAAASLFLVSRVGRNPGRKQYAAFRRTLP